MSDFDSPVIPSGLKWFITERGAQLVETRDDGTSLWRVNLTPKKAERLLRNHNGRNRDVREVQVLAFRDVIKRGEWLSRYEIVFDEDGEIADGQHRLGGIVSAGQRVRALVLINLPRNQILKQVPEIVRRAADELALNYLDGDGAPLRVSKQQQAIYTALRRVMNEVPRNGKVSAAELLEATASPLWPLVCFGATLRSKKFIGCMPLRLAAILAVHNGHTQEAVRAAWNNWLNGTVDAFLVRVRDDINRRDGASWSKARGEWALSDEIQCYAQGVVLRLLGVRHGKMQRLKRPMWRFASSPDDQGAEEDDDSP